MRVPFVITMSQPAAITIPAAESFGEVYSPLLFQIGDKAGLAPLRLAQQHKAREFFLFPVKLV